MNAPADDTARPGWRRKLLFRLCVHSGRFGASCLNTVLAAVACLQATVAAFVYFQKEIPIPEFVERQLSERLEKFGVFPVADEITFDLTGRITARGLALYDQRSGDILASVPVAFIDLDVAMLFIRRVSIDTIAARGAELFVPPFYSASGVRETLIEHLHGDIRQSEDTWEIERLNFQLRELRGHVHGQWPEAGFALIRRPGEIPALQPRPLERYLRYAAEGLNFSRSLDRLENPVVSAVVEPQKEASPIAAIEFLTDSFEDKNLGRATRLRLTVPAVELPGLHVLQPITVSGNSFARADGISTGVFHLAAMPVSLDPASLLEANTLQFAINTAIFRGVGIDGAVGVIDPTAHPSIKGTAQLTFRGRPANLSGSLDARSLAGAVRVDSRLDFNAVMTLPPLQEYHMGDVLDFAAPPGIRADIVFTEGLAFETANFDVDAEPVSYRGARFSRATARGRVNTEGIQISEIGLENPEYRIAGTMETAFETGDYRLLLEGSIYPRDINPFMDPWWDMIWEEFDFVSPLDADVDLRANWKTNKLAFHYGHASGNHVAYRRVEFEKLEMMTRALPGLVEIFDIDARRPEGAGSGELKWIYVGKYPVARLLDLETGFDVGDLATFLGNDVEATIKDFDLSAPPKFRIDGAIFTRFAPSGQGRDLRMHAKADAPLTYFDYPLDFLEFDGYLTDDRFDATELKFGFVGGRGEGSLAWRRESPSNRLDVVASLKGARQIEAFKVLGWLAEPDAAAPGEAPKAEPVLGLLDMNVQATGVPGDFYSFTGKGDIRVSEADLGTVHLFGGLSRALYGTWVDFTTLNLDSAQGQFLLDRERVEFEELNFSGPKSVVWAAGDIDMPRRDLDFRVRVYYLDNREKPLLAVIGPLLKPLGSALELRLWGTLEEPKWRFQLDPRNVFGGPVTTRSEGDEEQEKSLLPPLGPPIESSDL